MLKGEAVKIENLSAAQTKKMFEIMAKYYDNITEGNFYNDLLKKADAVLFCDENNDIYGFTTLSIFQYDEHTQLLFSGDTIIEKEYWGNNNLPQAWLNNAMPHAERFNGRTYWLLLTKGYKTYKFLHTFFNTFYPRFDTDTPQELQNVIDKFATEQYGDKYKNGVLVAGRDFLKDEFAQIDEAKLKDKNTAFFAEKNPNFANGDELFCITELSMDNLNRLGRKMLGR